MNRKDARQVVRILKNSPIGYQGVEIRGWLRCSVSFFDPVVCRYYVVRESRSMAKWSEDVGRYIAGELSSSGEQDLVSQSLQFIDHFTLK